MQNVLNIAHVLFNRLLHRCLVVLNIARVLYTFFLYNIAHNILKGCCSMTFREVPQESRHEGRRWAWSGERGWVGLGANGGCRADARRGSGHSRTSRCPGYITWVPRWEVPLPCLPRAAACDGNTRPQHCPNSQMCTAKNIKLFYNTSVENSSENTAF